MKDRSKFLKMYGRWKKGRRRYVFYRDKLLMLEYDESGELHRAGVVNKIGDEPDAWFVFLYGGRYVKYERNSIFSLSAAFWKDGYADWGSVFEDEELEGGSCPKREKISLDKWIEDRLSHKFPKLLPPSR